LETKEKAGIFQPAVCIGETNTMNLELFFATDYYKATLERYEEIKKFEEVNLLVM
jgi:hypothetical protein